MAPDPEGVVEVKEEEEPPLDEDGRPEPPEVGLPPGEEEEAQGQVPQVQAGVEEEAPQVFPLCPLPQPPQEGEAPVHQAPGPGHEPEGPEEGGPGPPEAQNPAPQGEEGPEHEALGDGGCVHH